MMPRLPLNHRQSPGLRCINFFCAVLLTLVLVAGIVVLVMWLSLRPRRPKFELADFDVQYANQQSLANLPVRFTVNEHNPNTFGINYEAIYASVYYGDQLIASGPAGNFPFFEVAKGSTPVQGSLTASVPTPSDKVWPRFFAGDVSAGSIAMRLLLNSTVRFQAKMDTRVHHIKVECDLKLGKDGTLQERYKNSPCAVYF